MRKIGEFGLEIRRPVVGLRKPGAEPVDRGRVTQGRLMSSRKDQERVGRLDP